MSRPVLQVDGLCMDFGGIRAMSELDLAVQQGQIVAGQFDVAFVAHAAPAIALKRADRSPRVRSVA